MGLGWYGRWMTRWETDLTTRDTNRIVRPLEWGFEWLADFDGDNAGTGDDLARMIALNEEIVRRSEEFFAYTTPTDFRLETRHPQLFPTNVRPETLAQEAEMRRAAEEGELAEADFLRFTSPVRTPHAENDQVNARWYPAAESTQKAGAPKQAIIVMPQWNSDAISHNSLCTMFNRFGVSALRLSKPYHDIRRPAELERSDYAMSANVGRTISACRQAVADIRSCMDWLETQGYTQFGVMGTSLGSCYGFIAAAHDPRLRVCAFNHASTWFGDVVWEGQSTRHVRAGFEQAGLTQAQVRELFRAISPMAYMDRFAAHPKESLVVYGLYDLTFPLHLSLDVLRNFRARGVRFTSRVLPCGHYTTGETPFKYLDGLYLGSFVRAAFRRLAATERERNAT
jgi:dienelactone hydrolase